MSTSRPTKHGRAASAVSGVSPKRAKEDQVSRHSTQLSDMSWEKQELQRRGQKRDNVEVEDSTEAGSQSGSEDNDETTNDNEVISKTRKKPSKSARIEGKDSVLKKEKRERQAQLQSVGSIKGKGKRLIDDSEDREIGEEWVDLNGLRWKMGEDGQIRREAVIVEQRPKYPSMPKDSRHPDAKIKVPVLVERFLTEREYEEARAKKLLSFQEMDRQRELEEIEAAAKKKQQEELEARQKRAAENGRQVTTPRKIRDLQALFQSARKPSSPLSSTLPLSTSRSGSISSQQSQPNTPYTSVKRLSLSMGRDEAASPSPRKPITPQAAQTTTPQKAKVSYRLSLASPSSPGLNKVNASSIRSSPLNDLKAKRKREEALLKLLQEEADRRQRRQGIP